MNEQVQYNDKISSVYKYVDNVEQERFKDMIIAPPKSQFIEEKEWILEDGTWNDDGIWKDDETWNDS